LGLLAQGVCSVLVAILARRVSPTAKPVVPLFAVQTEVLQPVGAMGLIDPVR
jgi:hypothetical protein